jgi:hypothetical protein
VLDAVATAKLARPRDCRRLLNQVAKARLLKTSYRRERTLANPSLWEKLHLALQAMTCLYR